MKTIFTIALALSTHFISAQTDPLPLSVDGTWQMYWFSMASSDDGTFAHRLLTQVSFNDTNYYPVEKLSYCDDAIIPEVAFYIREDSGKWYQRYLENETETLLFDFTLETGDEISLHSQYDSYGIQTLQVISIDEVTMYDGSTRSQWTLEYIEGSDLAGNTEIWIEGIGNQVTGLIHSLSHTCIDLNTVLHCFIIQEERLYPSYEFPIGIDCCTPVGILEDANQADLIVHLNPTTSELNIQSPNSISSIEISDLTGRIVFTLQPNATQIKLNLESFSNGCYIISATIKGGNRVSSRFIKD